MFVVAQFALLLSQAGLDKQHQGTPGARLGHSLVYDDRLGRVLLVDGYSEQQPPDQGLVWSWDGTKWQVLQGTGPEPRLLGGAAYDSSRHRLVIFGGRSARTQLTLHDTWEWNGTHWHRVSMAETGRDHMAMTFDAARNRVVMFGGTCPTSNVPAREQTQWTWPTDVWEWNGNAWTIVAAPGPGSRNLSSLAYDAARKVSLLFGGFGEDRVYRGDTWAWNGLSWQLVSNSGPKARAGHKLVFDAGRKQVMLYGGTSVVDGKVERLEDMWRWNGSTWTEVDQGPVTPGPRVGFSMAYDVKRRRTVLFGGSVNGVRTDDTWEWDGRSWMKVSPP
jgi:hypothetical protein